MPCPHSKHHKCNTCTSRDKRQRNPMWYAYDTLKANCKRRKGAGWFELTFEEFSAFAIEMNYLVGKGITKTGFTIDRIDNEMGYFVGNIRIMTNSGNSRKARKVLNYEYDESAGRMIATVSSNLRQSQGGGR